MRKHYTQPFDNGNNLEGSYYKKDNNENHCV